MKKNKKESFLKPLPLNEVRFVTYKQDEKGQIILDKDGKEIINEEIFFYPMTKELMNLPEVVEITNKMTREKVTRLSFLLQGFLERKEEINKTYNMTNDDEQLKAFAIETARVLLAEKE